MLSDIAFAADSIACSSAWETELLLFYLVYAVIIRVINTALDHILILIIIKVRTHLVPHPAERQHKFKTKKHWSHKEKAGKNLKDF